MSATITPTPTPMADDVTADRLSRNQLLTIAGGAVLIGALSWIPTGAVNWARWIVVGLVSYVAATYVISRRVEGRRKAVDRVMAAVVTCAFLIVVLPLVSVIWTVVSEGAARLDAMFLTDTMRLTPEELAGQNDGVAAGGAYHAIIGTLITTGLATAFSVPFGLFTAIYLVEYGRGKLASAITAMVDVMTGIPSIVAGLFAYALFVLVLGPGTRTGLAGAVALTVLMTPVVVRSAEEMLRLVPNELREASYALGVPKWKTVVKIVIPTAIAGILTGITLAIARVIGETAPLLVTVGLAQDTNYNPLDGRMTTLPVYTYYQYVQPGIPVEAGQDRAWAAALVLVVIVAILFSTARVLATILKPKGLR
jgi:phosphate transport system permease protein